MSRKYTKIDQYEKQILSMREEGRTHREIAGSLGLDAIHLTMKSVKTESRRELHLHSDQRFQYTSQAYIST